MLEIINVLIIELFGNIDKVIEVIKFGNSIREKHYINKIEKFLIELNNGSVDEIKKKSHQYKLNNDKKFAEKELTRVLIVLDKFIDENKAILLARLYQSFINEEISWKLFCEYTEVINQIFIEDINCVYNYINVDSLNYIGEEYRLNRLSSLGLIKLNPKTQFTYGQVALTENDVEVTEFGKTFIKIIGKIDFDYYL